MTAVKLIKSIYTGTDVTALGELASGDTVEIPNGSSVNGSLDFKDSSSNANHVSIKAPTALAASYTLTMPVDDGNNGQMLVTNGDGNLSWVTPLAAGIYSSTVGIDNALVRYNGATGGLVKNSVGSLDDLGNLTGLLSVSATTFNGNLTGNADTATASANLAGGSIGQVSYQSAADTTAFVPNGTAGQVLKSNGNAAPTWSNLGSLAVTSISFGTTGLTPSTNSNGAVVVGGTLALANGGTGATTVAAAQANLQVDSAGTALAMAIALS